MQAVNSMLANRGEDVQPSELMRQWDAAIRRNELGLLQRHLHDSLTSGQALRRYLSRRTQAIIWL